MSSACFVVLQATCYSEKYENSFFVITTAPSEYNQWPTDSCPSSDLNSQFSHLGFNSPGSVSQLESVKLQSALNNTSLLVLQRQRGFCCVCDELHPAGDRSCSPAYCPASHFFLSNILEHNHNHTVQKWQGAYKFTVCLWCGFVFMQAELDPSHFLFLNKIRFFPLTVLMLGWLFVLFCFQK